MKLINFTQTLFTRGAVRGHHVPLIRFPNRHGKSNPIVPQSNNSNSNSNSKPQSNSNRTYTDFSKAPSRLKMRVDEMDLVVSGGAY